MTGNELRDVAHILLNIGRDELEQDGVINLGQVGGSDWKRFDEQPLMFILKLPPDRLAKLAAMVTAELV